MTPKTPSATERVFGTPELLELILLVFSQRDLLTAAQRVCQDWHRNILASMCLQRLLGFAPDDSILPAERRHSELLLLRFPKLIVHDIPDTTIQGALPRQPERDQKHNDARRQALTTPAVRFHSASWLSMQVSQPPVRKLVIVDQMRTFTFPQSTGRWFRGVYEFPKGLIMGELFLTGVQRVGLRSPGAQSDAERPGDRPDRPVGFSLSCRRTDVEVACKYRDGGAGGSSWCWEDREREEMGDEAALLAAQTDAVLVFWMGNAEDTHWTRAGEV